MCESVEKGKEDEIDISSESDLNGDVFFRTPGYNREKHADDSRRYIAYGLVLLLIIVYLATITCYVVGCISTKRFDAIFNVAISGLAALVGTVIGFYFGKNS